MNDLVSILKCPACGAALDLAGSSGGAVRCKFCGNVVQVSGSVAAQPPAAISPALEQIRQLARSDRLIEAIKQYRALTNVGLAEAKATVEALRDGR